MLVVSPRGVGTWFVDAPSGGPDAPSMYATFLTKSLVPFVDAHYRTIAARGDRAVVRVHERHERLRQERRVHRGGVRPAARRVDEPGAHAARRDYEHFGLSLIHISEPTRL